MFLQYQIIIWYCPSSQPCRFVCLDITSIIKSTQVTILNNAEKYQEAV
jgi:hypothetical protein